MLAELLQTETWTKTLLDFWPIIATVAGVIFGIIGFALGWRWIEKAGIDKANEKAVNALKELLAARDAEIADGDAEIERLTNDCKDKQSAFLELESEYKAIAGIVLGELLIWASRYDEYRAEMAAKDSKIRILTLQIEAMERIQADLHISKP
jgi:chromosome segregation ATPase